MTIVNSLKLNLKVKIIDKENNRNGVNVNKKFKKENVLNDRNKRCSAVQEQIKFFTKINPPPTKTDANDNRQAPKKIVINPNLYGKDGTIRIMSSKDKTNTKVKQENGKDVKSFLYGETTSEVTGDKRVAIYKNKKIEMTKEENEKKANNTFLSSKCAKKKPEHQKRASLLESLINPKSKYEQEASKENKQSKAPVKIQNKAIMSKLNNNNNNGNNGSLISLKKKIEDKLNLECNDKSKENLKIEEKKEEKNENNDEEYEIKKSKTDIRKNRNLSTETRQLKNLKDKYNISNTFVENPANELNKKMKEYHKKEYCNIEPITYTQLLDKIKAKRKIERETFCEAFFIASFPCKNGKVIENSQSFPAACGHKKCSVFPAMKPEIIMRYPLEDTKNLELNNLAATICFPTGIKVCYNEEEPTNMIDDYLTSLTNQKGERYYMMTYHFYQKINNSEYTTHYEMYPLKNHLMKFGDSYLALSDEGFTEKIIKKVQETLELCEELGFREYVYVPFCICIISKYPYAYEMTRSLQSIFNVISEEEIMGFLKTDFKINDLIMYLVNSIPIPIEKNTRAKFYIPFFEKGISLKCPKLDDINIVNINYMQLIDLFSIDNFIIIIRLLLFEKKILFIDDNYTRLSEVSDAFISLLYPFQWIHTYIPIMSDQMLKYLETFLPFLNGVHSSLMPLVTQLICSNEFDDSDEIFLIYIKEGRIDLSSTLRKKKIKVAKYIQNNIPPLPASIEKNVKSKLTEIKNAYNKNMKVTPKRYSRVSKPVDPSQFDINIRDALIKMFVEMFKDYPKYMCILDNDVVFNKNSFMKSVNKADKKFYETFIGDTQIFQQFTQSIFTEECDYFNKMIRTEEAENNSEFSGIPLEIQNEKVYVIPPVYLGTQEKENKAIERYVCQYYPTDLESNFVAKEQYKNHDGIIMPSHRIIPSVPDIEEEDYNNDNCLVYFLPNQKNVSMKRSLLRDSSVQVFEAVKNQAINKDEIEKQGLKKTFTSANFKEELKDSEKEDIKDIIKDYLKKIFKSEKIEYKDPKIKTEILNIIKRPFAREFFVSLLSSNLKNVVLLRSHSFTFLRFLIYNVLVEILQIAETDKLFEEVYLLIKSTIYFGTEYKKKTLTLFENLKKKIRNYPFINQKNFWNIWFEKEMEAKNDKGDSTKQIIILNICSRMTELELSKMFVKDILDDLNQKAFEKSVEMGNQTQKMYLKKIKQVKYTIKESNNI